MAGTISLSLSQQFDSQGEPLSGGKLYFFQAGTTTPQSAYQDTALTIPHANPMILDAAGRVAQFFLANGEIKIRLDNSEGVTQLAADNILVIGASSGSGGTSVDATKILDTGDIKVRYGTGVLTGFVRCNARTIGSATSGATERANADTEALFLYLWNNDANLSVSGGRGANAAADWAANKTIALPDWRGRLLAGLDDMGASAAGRLTSAYFGTGATTLGAAGGSQSGALLQSDLPQVAVDVSATGTVVNITNFLSGGSVTTTADSPGGAGGFAQGQSVTNQAVVGVTGSTAAINGGVAQTNFGKVPPTMLATIYLKL